MRRDEATHNRKQSLGAVIGLLTSLLMSRMREWPLTLEFADWRLDVLFGCLLACSIGLTAVILGRTVHRAWLRALLGWAGLALLIGSPLLLLTRLVEPDQKLIAEYEVSHVHYRLYTDHSGGTFMPSFAVLKKERGPVFGFKLVTVVWVNMYYCCALEIKPRGISAITVVDRLSGTGVFSTR